MGTAARDPRRRLHSRRGNGFLGEGPVNARNDWSDRPGPILATIADAMLPSHFTGGHVVVVLGPLHARILADGGLTREDIQAELHRRAVRSTADLERAGRLPGGGGSDDVMRHVVSSS